MSVHELKCYYPNCNCKSVCCVDGGPIPANQPPATSKVKMAHDLLREAAKTFEERNKVYGDNYKMVGEVMKGLFPNGVTLNTPHDHNRFHILMLMVVKLTRYAVNWKSGHQDSIRDATVYGAMLEMIDGMGEKDGNKLG